KRTLRCRLLVNGTDVQGETPPPPRPGRVGAVRSWSCRSRSRRRSRRRRPTFAADRPPSARLVGLAEPGGETRRANSNGAGTMRKLTLVVTAVVGAWSAAPARAITGNFVKDFEHPYVGLVVFYDASGAFSHRCSGSLLTPRVLLTAGHCVFGVASARVYFQQD